jgi:hypothetical protein
VKPLCPGDRVTEVSLILAPEGHLDDSESGTLWQITSKTGSRQDRYVVGTTPTGFVEEVHLSRVPGEAEGLAATIDTVFDAQALQTFVPNELRSDHVLEPDGYFTLASSRLVTEIVAPSSRTVPPPLPVGNANFGVPHSPHRWTNDLVPRGR